MSNSPKLTLFHAPNSRSTGALTLLEELGVPFELNVLNLKAGQQLQPAYLAVNPMGKVPAVRAGDAFVTEQVAIFIYLADLFPEKGLAPAATDPLRGAYLRWLVYYAACLEPAIIDHHMKRDPAPRAMSPYGDYETVVQTITDQLAHGPYLLGERFSAADVLWGTALGWITAFGLFPASASITAYLERIASRPAALKAKAKDAELAAAQEAGG